MNRREFLSSSPSRKGPYANARRFALAVTGAIVIATSVVGVAYAARPLSVETFFRKAEYGGASLSPNGRYLAVIATVEGQRGLVVLDLDSRAATKMKSPGAGDLLRVIWQDNERLIVIVGDLQRASGEPPRESGMVAINRDGSDSRVVNARFDRPRFVTLIRVIEGTHDVLLAARERNIENVDVYRVDTVTGAKTLVTLDSPGEVSRWVVDFDGVPRAVVTNDVGRDRSAWFVRQSANDPWVEVENAKLGRLTSEPLEFDPDGKLLYVAARRDGADRAAIVEYDVAAGAWKQAIVRHPVRDLDEDSARFVTDYRERKLLGLRYADDKPRVVWFDAARARLQASVDKALPDTVNLIQLRGERAVVVAFSDRNPGEAFLLDTKSLRLDRLFTYAPWIDPAAMAPMRWVTYTARDGLAIPALLSAPADAPRGAPLVVLIHGGPYVQADAWAYNPEVQFLVSRGYAVLQPQFRGTGGFGWHLESAGFRAWGAAMQDDLEDGVKWAVAQGIADPERVCFYGASYGGYAAAWGAIHNAKTIRCAVAYVGVTSIDYLFDNVQTDLARLADKSTLMVDQIGDPKTERARFKRVNPLDNADKVGVPILLAYGAADLRVPLVHGTDFRAALDREHKPYEWVVYAGEGHGFSKDENLVDFYGRVERFLGKYIGGVVTTTDTDSAPPR